MLPRASSCTAIANAVWRSLPGQADVIARVAAGVRMGKRVPQIEPDLPVVGVPHERLDVRRPPGSHLARFEGELHAVSLLSCRAAMLKGSPYRIHTLGTSAGLRGKSVTASRAGY